MQIKNERADLGELYDSGVRYSTTFAEKPDIETAKRFIQSGDFLWNTGIFVWSLYTFWRSFDKYLPENKILFEILKKTPSSQWQKSDVEYVYRQLQAVSVDYAILEKADNVFVVEAAFNWSDLGNWDELYRLSIKDGRNNLIEGNVVAMETSNCFISSTEKLIGVVGVKDLFILEGEDAILICKRGASEDIKDITDYLRRKQINKYL